MEEKFLTDIVHDLKTPITSIIGFIELLQKGDQSEAARKEYYDIIDSEAHRLLNMINNVLHICKDQNSAEPVEDEKSDVSIQIGKYVDELKPLASKRNVRIDVNSDPDLFVSIPESKISRIFLNIIENAIKYNKDNGQILINIYKEDKKIIVKIRDTGLGIPPEDIDKIFNKYYRSSDHRKLEIPGTGLGLTIANDIVKSYGGKIDVSSEVGKKTEFTVIIPEASL